MTMTRLDRTFLAIAGAWLLIGAALFLATPGGRDGGIGWTEPMIRQGWMAWVLPTALFFHAIAGLLLLFSWLGLRFPETPRVGILRFATTRGDRLFISLLGSAFICLAWLGLVGPPLWGGLAVCLVYAAAVFRWV
jgi:predicted small integral membrane protein